MPTVLQFRRGTTTQNNNFTGSVGEISIDTTLDTLRVHDGSTQGGFEITRNTAAQTLTTKTIDADNNTITNIGDDELSSGISAIKIGNGDVDNTELSYLNGVTSAIQTQIDTKAATTFAVAFAVAFS